MSRSETQKALWADPEHRAKRMAALRTAADGRWKQARLRQIAILADWATGVPTGVIAKTHGCTKAYPSILAKRRGVSRPGAPK